MAIEQTYPSQSNVSSQILKYRVPKDHSNEIRLYSTVRFGVYMLTEVNVVP